MKSNYDFYWKKQGLDIHNLPIKLKRNSVSKTMKTGHYMCHDCYEKDGQVYSPKQLYECPNCEAKLTTGQIIDRYIKDYDDTKLVFSKDEFTKFMDIETSADIIVNGESPMVILPYIMPLIQTDYELFSNDEKTQPIIKAIYEYLLKNNKMLLVTISDTKTAIITPSYDRLTTYLLRDKRTIKLPNQLGLSSLKLEHFLDIQQIYESSIDKKIDLLEKFLEFKRSGRKLKITVKPKQHVEKFASDLTALMV